MGAGPGKAGWRVLVPAHSGGPVWAVGWWGRVMGGASGGTAMTTQFQPYRFPGKAGRLCVELHLWGG